MRTILRIAMEHGNEALVLGAMGCGAFANPPREIARLFHEVLMEKEFERQFKEIVFAILEDRNSEISIKKERLSCLNPSPTGRHPGPAD